MYQKFDKIQEQLDSLPVLYLEKFKSVYSFNEWSLYDFLLQFLVSLSETSGTMQKGTLVLESKPCKRRSIGDMYRIAKYYYNDVTLLEVQWTLANLWKDKKIGYFWCNSSKKRMYMSIAYYKTHTINPVEYPAPDEYGIKPVEIQKLSETIWDNL